MPPMKEASRTMMNPSRLNWVDSYVNINRPPEMSSTTTIRNGFCQSSMGKKFVRCLFITFPKAITDVHAHIQ